MYPNTEFEIVDLSGKVPQGDTFESIINEVIVSSTEKGPEDMRYVTKENYKKLYGEEFSFNKHGQPIVQFANAVENGATVLFKRLVASDATLANVAVLARVKKTSVQKVNEEGKPLYTDPSTGKETTSTGEDFEPVMIQKCTIKYECQTVQNTKTIAEQYATIGKKLLDEFEDDNTSDDEDNPIEVEEEYVYPLFVIADIGRGLSKKRFRISPDYDGSKYKDYIKYELSIIENNTIVEKNKFILDHNYIENDKNKSIENVSKNSTQVQVKMYEDNFDKFVAKVAEFSGYDEDYILECDLLFGNDKTTQSRLTYIDVDLDEGFNLSFVYGISLDSGSNGAFGTNPFGSKEWIKQAKEFFDGTFNNRIFDLYNTPIDVIIDANYPAEVKSQIEDLAIFREDLVYMRDSGLNVKTKDEIVNFNSEFANSKFIMPYHLSYDIIDPSTKKQIPVTVGYSLSRLMVNHFRNGRNRPVAGFIHEMTIPEAIEGTVNYLPSITPNVNERKELDETRINYASYYDNVLVLETFYTSQENKSDFSYGNNVLATQELMKAIRAKCPKIRYSFTNDDDLTTYQEDVNAVISKYAGNFYFCEMQYAEDEAAIEDKVYYALIYISFRPFVQAEKFKLIALPTATTLDDNK